LSIWHKETVLQQFISSVMQDAV